jgi:hypothetical protein
MNTLKTLEKMHALQALDDRARDSFILEFIDELKAELLKEEAKKNGTAKAKKAADNILKQLKNAGRVSGARIDSAGVQIIGGAYSAVRLTQALPLEELPQDAKLPDYNGIIEETAKNNGEPLPLPSAAELSAYIKSKKAAHKGARGRFIMWDFGEDLPLVDAIYLLDILYLLDDVVCIPSSRSNLTALYFKGSNGDGMLLPRRRC